MLLMLLVTSSLRVVLRALLFASPTKWLLPSLLRLMPTGFSPSVHRLRLMLLSPTWVLLQIPSLLPRIPISLHTVFIFLPRSCSFRLSCVLLFVRLKFDLLRGFHLFLHFVCSALLLVVIICRRLLALLLRLLLRLCILELLIMFPRFVLLLMLMLLPFFLVLSRFSHPSFHVLLVQIMLLLLRLHILPFVFNVIVLLLRVAVDFYCFSCCLCCYGLSFVYFFCVYVCFFVVFMFIADFLYILSLYFSSFTHVSWSILYVSVFVCLLVGHPPGQPPLSCVCLFEVDHTPPPGRPATHCILP